MFYFDKDDPDVLFCDKRNLETVLCDGRKFEIHPDVQCDFTDLPFESNTFRMVVFDPPHLTRNTGKSKYGTIYGSLTEPSGYQQIKYGSLESGWMEMIAKGFQEGFRVLIPGGFMVFKWSEIDIPVSKILKLTDEKPIFGHRSGKASKTHWMLFMKRETRNP